MKYITEADIDDVSKNNFKSYLSEKPILYKNDILKYLRSFSECAFTSEPVKDKYTDEIVYDADNARSDGEYIWYESEIYHFEKYNLKLNEDFIKYVLKRS